jgi:hypothetical protein
MISSPVSVHIKESKIDLGTTKLRRNQLHRALIGTIKYGKVILFMVGTAEIKRNK